MIGLKLHSFQLVYLLCSFSADFYWGGFSSLKDQMLEKFQPIKIPERFYWLNAFLTKSKSISTENVLNKWKIILKILQIAGYNRITIHTIIKINEFIRTFQS